MIEGSPDDVYDRDETRDFPKAPGLRLYLRLEGAFTTWVPGGQYVVKGRFGYYAKYLKIV